VSRVSAIGEDSKTTSEEKVTGLGVSLVKSVEKTKVKHIGESFNEQDHPESEDKYA
jgi:hypothetical protein